MKRKLFLIYSHDAAPMGLIVQVLSCWLLPVVLAVTQLGCVWFFPGAATGKRLASKRVLDGIAHDCVMVILKIFAEESSLVCHQKRMPITVRLQISCNTFMEQEENLPLTVTLFCWKDHLNLNKSK